MSLGESPSKRGRIRIRLTVPRAAVIGVATAGLALGLSTATIAAPATAATTVAPLGISAGGTLQWMSQSDRDWYFSAMKNLGATWLRMDFPWSDIQRSAGGSFDFARYDKVVSDAQRYGISVMPILQGVPAWARDPACAGSTICRPRSAAEFGTFAGAVASHFASRGVHYYEIWNEPNQTPWYAPSPNPSQYAELLKAVYPKIHAGDANAKVILGGAAPAATGDGNYSPIDFLSGVYAAGAGNSFDILGAHPYCFAGTFDCPRQAETWSAWTQMSDTKVSMRSVMASHGDGGKSVWGTEFGAPTGGSQATSEAQQATQITNGLKMFGEDSWSGPLFIYGLKDLGTDKGNREHWFGLIRADGSYKPSFGAIKALMDSSQQRPISNSGGGTSGGTTVEPAPAPQPVATTPAPVVTQPPAPPVSQENSWWTWLVKWLNP